MNIQVYTVQLEMLLGAEQTGESRLGGAYPLCRPDGVGNAYQAGQHSFQAAKYTYQNPVQNYELKFRTFAWAGRIQAGKMVLL